MDIKMRKLDEHRVCILILAIMFASCRGSRLEVMRELKRNPEIEKILFVKRISIDSEYIAEIELVNGGRLIVLLDSPSAVIYVMEIGQYTGYTLTMNKWNGKWYSGNYEYVLVSVLEKVLENKEVHLNGIIDAYNKILAFYESIYNEPPIPGKIGDEIDSWGNEEILRKYAGYVIDGSSKYKIYVRRIDDSSEKRLPESMLRQRN